MNIIHALQVVASSDPRKERLLQELELLEAAQARGASHKPAVVGLPHLLPTLPSCGLTWIAVRPLAAARL